MFKKFYPNMRVKSVFHIDYKGLYKKGYRGIIFDLDNTLVHHGDDSNEKVDRLFKDIHNIGLKTVILSDNTDERIQRFLKNIDTSYVSDAEKPNPKGYQKALQLLGTKKEETICVGDQIFTDIYGANNAGLKSILVEFIREPNVKKIGKKRRVEQIILKFYKLNRHYKNANI